MFSFPYSLAFLMGKAFNPLIILLVLFCTFPDSPISFQDTAARTARRIPNEVTQGQPILAILFSFPFLGFVFFTFVIPYADIFSGITTIDTRSFFLSQFRPIKIYLKLVFFPQRVLPYKKNIPFYLCLCFLYSGM